MNSYEKPMNSYEKRLVSQHFEPQGLSEFAKCKGIAVLPEEAVALPVEFLAYAPPD